MTRSEFQKIKAGDRIKVVKGPPDQFNLDIPWSAWVPNMDDFIGTEFEISRDIEMGTDDNSILLGDYYYPMEALEFGGSFYKDLVKIYKKSI